MGYIFQVGLILSCLKLTFCQYGPIKTPNNDRTTTPFPPDFRSDNEIYNVPNSGYLSNTFKSSEIFQNKVNKNKTESIFNQHDNFLPGIKNLDNSNNLKTSVGAVTALDNPWLKNIISQTSNLEDCNKGNKCSSIAITNFQKTTLFPSCPLEGFGCVLKELCQDGQTPFQGEERRQCYDKREYCCKLLKYDKQKNIPTQIFGRPQQANQTAIGQTGTHGIFGHSEQINPILLVQHGSPETHGTFGHSEQPNPTAVAQQPGSGVTYGTEGTFGHSEQPNPTLKTSQGFPASHGTFGHSDQPNPTAAAQPGSGVTHETQGTFGHSEQPNPTLTTSQGFPASHGTFGHSDQPNPTAAAQPGSGVAYGHSEQQNPTLTVSQGSPASHGTFGRPVQSNPTAVGQPGFDVIHGSQGTLENSGQPNPTAVVQQGSGATYGTQGIFGHSKQPNPTGVAQPGSGVTHGTQGTFAGHEHPNPTLTASQASPASHGTFGRPVQSNRTAIVQPGSGATYETQGIFGHSKQPNPTGVAQPGSGVTHGTQGTFAGHEHPNPTLTASQGSPASHGTFGHSDQPNPTLTVSQESPASHGTFGRPVQSNPTAVGQPGSGATYGTQGIFGHSKQPNPTGVAQPGSGVTHGTQGTFAGHEHPNPTLTASQASPTSHGTFGRPVQSNPTAIVQPGSGATYGTQGIFGHSKQPNPTGVAQPGSGVTYGTQGTFAGHEHPNPTLTVSQESPASHGTFGRPVQSNPTAIGQPGSGVTYGTQGIFGHSKQPNPTAVAQPGSGVTHGTQGTFGGHEHPNPTLTASQGSPASHGTFGHSDQPNPTLTVSQESPASHGTFGRPVQSNPTAIGQPGSGVTYGTQGIIGHSKQPNPTAVAQPGFGVTHGTQGTFGGHEHQNPTLTAPHGSPGTHGSFGRPMQSNPTGVAQPGSGVTHEMQGTFGHSEQPNLTAAGQPGSSVPHGSHGTFGRHEEPIRTITRQPESIGMLGTLGYNQNQGSKILGQTGSPARQGTFGHSVQPNPTALAQPESTETLIRMVTQGNMGTSKPGLHGIPIGGSIYDGSQVSQNPSISVTEVSFKKYTGPLNTTPHVGCPAALKCVEEIYCTWDGVMSDSPLVLTEEEQKNKVPLSECQNIETGIVGKCCRDPNYEDPWPSEQSHELGFNHSQHQTALNFQDDFQKKNSQGIALNECNLTVTCTATLCTDEMPNHFGLNFYIPSSTSTTQRHLNFQAPLFKKNSNNLITDSNSSTSFPSTSSVFGSNSGIYSAFNESTERPQGPPPGYPFFDLTTLSPDGNIIKSASKSKSSDSEKGCGLRKPVSRPNGADGITTGFGEFPWQAQVILSSDQSPLCSGAIVSKRAVVTSAYCINELNSIDIMVKTGDWKLGINNALDEPKSSQINLVAAIFRHPNFDPVTRFYDEAVLILSESVKTDSHIDTLCIGDEIFQEQKSKNNNCVVSGWGRESLKGNTPGSILHSISVNFINNEQCENAFKETFLGKYFQLNKSFGCILPIQANHDLCEVDIGSPIACQRQDGRYELNGIYSWDSGCERGSNTPAAFAKVDTKWLNSVIDKPTEQILEGKFTRDRVQNKSVNSHKSSATKPGFNQGYGK